MKFVRVFSELLAVIFVLVNLYALYFYLFISDGSTETSEVFARLGIIAAGLAFGYASKTLTEDEEDF